MNYSQCLIASVLRNSDHSVFFQDVQKLLLKMHSIQTMTSVHALENYITLKL